MLKIRGDQMRLFRDARRAELEARLHEQVWRIWRSQCHALGDAFVRRSIQEGIGRAERHGFRREADVSRFVHLMYAVSYDFEDDPLVPWAAQILADVGLSPRVRMSMLWARAKRELRALAEQARGSEDHAR
jgi:hypothetical protein